jgi:Beta-ketoacyl synthase, N-terminal domain
MVDVSITGVGIATEPASLAEMVDAALAACGGGGPIVMASCNGDAATSDEAAWRTSFELGRGPIVSAACASGMHALYLARRMIETGLPEVRVVAADRITTPSRSNFEALRILSEAPAPYQSRADGFRLGDGAVALHLTRSASGPVLQGPVLGHDLDDDDALDRVLAALGARVPELVIGQGAGPAANDELELAAIARHVARDIPLATALYRIGHTLGASSLLSVALAVQARTTVLDALELPDRVALDGRPLGGRRSQQTTVISRALGGACGACSIGELAPSVASPSAWGHRAAPPPLHDLVLRGLIAAAAAERPAAPPDLLVVTLDAPLQPVARRGTRILPSSVLEMTPGFTVQLVARAWGFRGAALCLVGGDPAPLLAMCRSSHERVYRIAIRGMEARDVEWDA